MRVLSDLRNEKRESVKESGRWKSIKHILNEKEKKGTRRQNLGKWWEITSWKWFILFIYF